MTTVALIGATGNVGRSFSAIGRVRGWSLIEVPRAALCRTRSELDPDRLDAVVNCAGVGMDSMRPTSGVQLLQANVAVALSAANLAMDSDARLIHVGSAAQQSEHLVRESPYVRSKHLASSALALLAETDGLKGMELLPHIIYGDPEPESHGVVSAMLRSILSGQPFGLRTPNLRRDFIHRDDVGRAIVAAIESNDQAWEAVEVGTGTGHTLSETAEMIGEIVGMDDSWKGDFSPGRGWAEDMVANPKPALDRLNFRSEIELRVGLDALAHRAMRGSCK